MVVQFTLLNTGADILAYREMVVQVKSLPQTLKFLKL